MTWQGGNNVNMIVKVPNIGTMRPIQIASHFGVRLCSDDQAIRNQYRDVGKHRVSHFVAPASRGAIACLQFGKPLHPSAGAFSKLNQARQKMSTRQVEARRQCAIPACAHSANQPVVRSWRSQPDLF
jgi:hypothetical protein